MADEEKIKAEVVSVFVVLSPLNLAEMADVESVKINFTSGFDGSMKKALCVPLAKIARRYGGAKSRAISQTETAKIKTIKGAVDLTLAAVDGLQFGGE